MDNLHDIFGDDTDLEEVNLEEESGGGSSLFENGVYDFLVERSELKPTNSGNGNLVAVMFRDRNSNRCLFQNYNVQNPSQMAVTIGKRDLKKLVKACGLDEMPSDPEELIDKPVSLKLIKQETKDSQKRRRAKPDIEAEYENVIKLYGAEKEKQVNTNNIGI